MKKYVKPELFYERYEVSERVAACDFDSKGSFTTVEACSFVGDEGGDWSGMVVFQDPTTACNWRLQEYCYHSGADGITLFNS